MAISRRVLGLSAVLVAAIATLLVVRSMNATGTEGPAKAPRTALPPNPAPAAAPARSAAPETSVGVNLQALGRPRLEPRDQGRNPFRFKPKPPPPPSVERQTPPPPVELSVVPIVPSGPPPPPPIPLKFIGIVQKADGTKIAVLSDGRRPIHGVEGQEIEGQYRILKIGVESIEMAYLDGRGRQTIRLTGQ